MSEPFPTTGRIAGIDFGTVRIGVALTDRDRTIASPFENYTRRNEASDAEYFRALVDREQVVQFVVGLPVHLDGHESEKSRQARQFGAWLSTTTGLPVDYFDERFSTVQAEQMLMGANMTKKRRKRRLDMLAAQILLSGYIESQCHGEREPGPLDD